MRFSIKKLMLLLGCLVQLNLPIHMLNADTKLFTEDELQGKQHLARLSDQQKLKLSKYFILQGNLRKAYYILNQIVLRPSLGNKAIELTKKRYLALIYFINGQYEEGLEQISSPEFKHSMAYREVCPLKLGMQFSLYQSRPSLHAFAQFKNEIEQCQRYTANYAGKEHLWLEGLKELPNLRSTQKDNYFTKILDFISTRPKLVATWIRLGLYTQKPELVLSNIERLELSSFLDPDIREMLALAHYRAGNNKEAFNFIEDLSTANAENLKARLLLDTGKYELAYGHFQLALEQKSDSLNALEALVPLAWMLRDTAKFSSYLEQLPLAQRAPFLMLRVLNYIETNQLKLAQGHLNLISTYSTAKPRVMSYMQNYINLKGMADGVFDPKLALHRFQLLNGSSQACDRGDQLNCWLWEQLQRVDITELKSTLLSKASVLPADFDLNFFIQQFAASTNTHSSSEENKHKTSAELPEAMSIDQAELEDLDRQSEDAFLIMF